MLTFILLVFLFGAPLLQDSHLADAPSRANVLADLELLELVPDPDLASPPEVVVIGESDEFTHDHDTDGEDGRAFLVWNHTAGTQLDFLENPEHDFIHCNDFIYLSQPLLWESNSSPYRVRVTMEYGFQVTGTFQTNKSGWNMFRASVWLMTPDYWVPIGWSIPQFNGNPQSYLIDLQESTIENAWSHLEISSNQISLAIGFAPKRWFEEYWDGSEPWRNYTGAVTMTIESVGLEVLHGRPASVEEMEPVHVGYWPFNASSYCKDFKDAEDGTIYSLFVDYGSELYKTTLVRWSESADVMWSTSLSMLYSFAGIAIGVHSGNVYVIGWYESSSGDNNSMMLLRWNSEGTLLSDKDLDFESLHILGIEMANDGSIYIVGRRYFSEPLHYVQESLLKIDYEGTLVWEKTLSRRSYEPLLLEVSNEGDVYVMGAFSLTKWDQDGNLLWNRTGIFFNLDLSPNGLVYTIEITYNEGYYGSWAPRAYLIERNSDGTVLWNHSINIHYTETWSESIQLYSMEVGTDGSLYLLFEMLQSEQKFRLAKYDNSGTQLWNKSLAPLSNESSYWFDGKMVLGRNGLIHIIGMHFDIESEVLSHRMLVYFDSDYPVDPFSLPETRLVIAFSLIAVLVVGDVVRRRRGLKFRA